MELIEGMITLRLSPEDRRDLIKLLSVDTSSEVGELSIFKVHQDTPFVNVLYIDKERKKHQITSVNGL